MLYSVYGLNLESELRLPELVGGEGAADAFARFGRVEVGSEGAFVFEVAKVGRFCVRGGREIVVDADAGVGEAELRLYLLGTALGALLVQRGVLAMHGSAVEIGSGAIALVGPSGVGKSTLAGALRRLGDRRLISDDVCALRFGESGEVWVEPGYPQAKLWLDSLEALGLAASPLRRVREGLEKRAVPVEEGFCGEARRLRAVFCLETAGETGAGGVERLGGAEVFSRLGPNTYRGQLVGAFGDRAKHFGQIAALCKSVPVYRLARVGGTMDMEGLCALVEGCLQK